MDLAHRAFVGAKQKLDILVHGSQPVEKHSLSGSIKEHIKKHPYMTAVQIALPIIAVWPMLAVSPGLALLGFGSLGPMAGFAAPAVQAATGTSLVFSAMQSAAMGGWGTSIVSGCVSAGGVVGSGVMAVLQKKKHDEDKAGKKK